MSHDDVQQPGAPTLPVFVIKRDQPVGRKRHYFPADQEEEGIGGSKDDRQAQKQEMEQKAEEADVPPTLESFQVAE